MPTYFRSADKWLIVICYQITTHLHDCVENISRGKVRDINDFEWRRNFRVYLNEDGKICVNVDLGNKSVNGLKRDQNA